MSERVFAEIDGESGYLRHVFSWTLEPTPEISPTCGIVLVEITLTVPMPEPGWIYDLVAGTFTAPDPPEPERLAIITKFEFLLRFTSAERAAIRREAKTNETVEDFMELINLAGEITIDHPMMGQGLDYMIYLGLIAPERKAELLA